MKPLPELPSGHPKDWDDREWRQFINRYCTTEDVAKTFRREIRPWTRLKELAMQRFKREAV